jgi:hypothetical protein
MRLGHGNVDCITRANPDAACRCGTKIDQLTMTLEEILLRS